MELTEEEYKKALGIDGSEEKKLSPAASHLRDILEHQGRPLKEASEDIGLDLQRLRDIIYGAVNITKPECQVLADWSNLRLSFWKNLSLSTCLKIHKEVGNTELIIRTSNGALEMAEKRKEDKHEG